MDNTAKADQEAADLASRQHGAITYTQAIKAGLSSERLRYLVRTGRLRRVARQTYVVAGAPATWRQTAMVACLAGPDGTVASHLTAAALFGLWEPPPDLPHVTVPRTASGRMKVATVHRSPLDPDDLGAVDGIPVTRPGRTIVDCAAVLAHDDLCNLVDDALCRSLCTADELHRAMERAGRGPGRAGLARLEQALTVWTPGAPPGSPAEMRLIRRLIGWGLPIPDRQVKIFDASGRFVAKVDVGWEDRRAGLETTASAITARGPSPTTSGA